MNIRDCISWQFLTFWYFHTVSPAPLSVTICHSYKASIALFLTIGWLAPTFIKVQLPRNSSTALLGSTHRRDSWPCPKEFLLEAGGLELVSFSISQTGVPAGLYWVFWEPRLAKFSSRNCPVLKEGGTRRTFIWSLSLGAESHICCSVLGKASQSSAHSDTNGLSCYLCRKAFQIR